MSNKFLLLFLVFLATLNSAHALEGGVSIPLVADRTTDGGDEGILLGATVIVTNGTGHVFVDTNPYTQVDLQGSARIAAMVASDVLGIDEKAYDFYYIIDISSPIIGGPSAGGALTVATIAAVNNWTVKPGVVMTGMINPDESIGPVGGIPYKLEAAAASNATLFLIPQGQSTVTIQNTTSRTNGPFIVNQVTTENVDVVELGKKLNVDVKEVGTIQDAVLAFTGHDINKPTYNGTIITPDYLNLLEPLAARLKNESGDMYEGVASQVKDDTFMNQAKEIQVNANNMYNEKKYYAATSLYFNSMIDIRIAQWNYGYSKASNKEQYLAGLDDSVQNQIQSSEKDLENFKLYGVSDVGAVGAAESRITAARARLNDARSLNDSAEKIQSLAFANERARTAQWWLTLALPTGKIIPENTLKDRAGWYLSQAQSISTYVQALLTESSGHPVISGTDNDITLAQQEMQRGYYSGAIFDSLQITVRSSTAIGLLGVDDANKKIEQSAADAEAAINEARMNGVEPTLAVSAYEYAETLNSTFDEISQYSYAKMVAKTSVILNSHAVASNKVPVKPTVTPYVPELVPTQAATAKTPTKPVPAFEAIAAVAAILIVRRLNKK
ncbi:Lon protease [uncultured archaeon]|nr:Lon protease [uncultured archaeon]